MNKRLNIIGLSLIFSSISFQVVATELKLRCKLENIQGSESIWDEENSDLGVMRDKFSFSAAQLGNPPSKQFTLDAKKCLFIGSEYNLVSSNENIRCARRTYDSPETFTKPFKLVSSDMAEVITVDRYTGELVKESVWEAEVYRGESLQKRKKHSFWFFKCGKEKKLF